jgi:uncharacterized phage protein (predicted DNA packaging)
MGKAADLLPKVKENLILEHDADDGLLKGLIRAAIDYAEMYQKEKYGRRSLPPSTEQAVIMLASHFYESRDGGTGGFFADTAAAAAHIWQAVNRLLALNKNIEV